MLTCLYPLAESAMVNLLPSLVKMGASSSSSQPPGEVITRLSPQSPCSAWHTLTTLQRAGVKTVPQKVASELHPKVRNHGEGPY